MKWWWRVIVKKGDVCYAGLFSCVWLFVTQWTIARSPGILQVRMLEWGCHTLLQGILPNPRNQTQVSRIANRFFTVWANREGQERWGNTLRVGQENSAQWADDFQAKSNKFKPVWTSYSTFPQHLYSTLRVLNWWPNEEMMPKWYQPSAFRHTHKNK